MKAKVKTKTINLVIDRRRWLCGEEKSSSDNRSCLYRSEDKKMCCLGFLARKVGAKVVSILDIGTPSNASSLKWPKGILRAGSKCSCGNPSCGKSNSNLTSKLMEINDNAKETPKNREAKIARGFAKIGVKVKYVGRYPAKKKEESRSGG